ncbi:uncharacterized protein LOC113519364 [Galleria mellonella]|uniref:Uncharacterized protein LOC113519364 n=1 Tax=Galleria mellonella TaxID=7137 RepID=A0A6J1WVX0_GALME|nr:uncharacterized protein LOC113519364 [Galleria mellonella]
MESEFCNSIDAPSKCDMFTKSEDIIEFVHEVRKRPCLYDNTKRDYSNVWYTKPAWKEISHKLNIPVIDCKEKWRKIRVAYMRSVKQMQSDNPPNRPYWLSEHLQFLIPFMQMYIKSGDKLKHGAHRSSVDKTNGIETTVVKQEEDSDSETMDDDIEENVTTEFTKEDNNANCSSIDLFNSMKTKVPFMQTCIKTSDKLKHSAHRSSVDKPNGIETIVIKQEDDSDLETMDDNIEENVTTEFIKEDNDVNCSSIDLFNSTETKVTDRGVKRHQDPMEYTPRKMFLLSLLPEIESLSEKEMRFFRRNIVNLMDNILCKRDQNS